jgi:mannose-6-phosphate isomerase-like protein (cupin superfamily)
LVRRVKPQQLASWSTRIGGDPKGVLVAGEGSKVRAAYVPAGGSRFRRQHEIRLAGTVNDIKVSTLDTGGALCVTEVTSVRKGGPVRHLHHGQDEWFYVLEGKHVIEVGEERTRRVRAIPCWLLARWRTRGPTSGRGREG